MAGSAPTVIFKKKKSLRSYLVPAASVARLFMDQLALHRLAPHERFHPIRRCNPHTCCCLPLPCIVIVLIHPLRKYKFVMPISADTCAHACVLSVNHGSWLFPNTDRASMYGTNFQDLHMLIYFFVDILFCIDPTVDPCIRFVNSNLWLQLLSMVIMFFQHAAMHRVI